MLVKRHWRALGVLLPTFLVGSIWVDGWLATSSSLLVGYVIAYQYFKLKLKSYLLTACITLTLCLIFAFYDSLLAIPLTHNSAYLSHVLTSTGTFSIISLVLALPAWLLFWGIDVALRTLSATIPS